MSCLNCGVDTINPKFCSRNCAAIYNNKAFPKRRPTRNCIWCDNKVKSHRHMRCSECHEKYLKTRFDHIQEITLKEYWNTHSLSNLPLSVKNSGIRGLGRTRFQHILKNPCARCGYNKHVELCHIKPISSFNENSKIKEINCYENLIQLCPNCHWEFDNGYFVLPVGLEPT